MGEENKLNWGDCAISIIGNGKLVELPILENNNIPTKCRRCLNFSGAYCEVHQHLIEDAANCSEFNDSEFTYGEYSEEDSRICVAHLREILDRCVEEGIGKDGIDKKQCVIVGVKLIEEKKRV